MTRGFAIFSDPPENHSPCFICCHVHYYLQHVNLLVSLQNRQGPAELIDAQPSNLSSLPLREQCHLSQPFSIRTEIPVVQRSQWARTRIGTPIPPALRLPTTITTRGYHTSQKKQDSINWHLAQRDPRVNCHPVQHDPRVIGFQPCSILLPSHQSAFTARQTRRSRTITQTAITNNLQECQCTKRSQKRGDSLDSEVHPKRSTKTSLKKLRGVHLLGGRTSPNSQSLTTLTLATVPSNSTGLPRTLWTTRKS